MRLDLSIHNMLPRRSRTSSHEPRRRLLVSERLRRKQQCVPYDDPRQNRSECWRSESQLLCLLPNALHESMCSIFVFLALSCGGDSRMWSSLYSFLLIRFHPWVGDQVSPPLPTVRALTTPLLVHAQRSQLSLSSDHLCPTLVFLNFCYFWHTVLVSTVVCSRSVGFRAPCRSCIFRQSTFPAIHKPLVRHQNLMDLIWTSFTRSLQSTVISCFFKLNDICEKWFRVHSQDKSIVHLRPDHTCTDHPHNWQSDHPRGWGTWRSLQKFRLGPCALRDPVLFVHAERFSQIVETIGVIPATPTVSLSSSKPSHFPWMRAPWYVAAVWSMWYVTLKSSFSCICGEVCLAVFWLELFPSRAVSVGLKQWFSCEESVALGCLFLLVSRFFFVLLETEWASDPEVLHFFVYLSSLCDRGLSPSEPSMHFDPVSDFCSFWYIRPSSRWSSLLLSFKGWTAVFDVVRRPWCFQHHLENYFFHFFYLRQRCLLSEALFFLYLLLIWITSHNILHCVVRMNLSSSFVLAQVSVPYVIVGVTIDWNSLSLCQRPHDFDVNSRRYFANADHAHRILIPDPWKWSFGPDILLFLFLTRPPFLHHQSPLCWTSGLWVCSSCQGEFSTSALLWFVWIHSSLFWGDPTNQLSASHHQQIVHSGFMISVFLIPSLLYCQDLMSSVITNWRTKLYNNGLNGSPSFVRLSFDNLALSTSVKTVAAWQSYFDLSSVTYSSLIDW